MKLPPFKLEIIFEEYEHEPQMLVLGASDASNLTVKELLDLCNGTVDIPNTRLKYGDVRGELRLREAIAKSYNSDQLTANQVLVTVGASEAIFIAVQVLVQAGESVLVCDPAYQPLASIPEALGASVEKYSYLESADFAPDVNSIISRLRRSPPIKLLILNTPHNPTGQAFSQPEMLRILEVAKETRTRVLVDEVFRGIRLGSTAPMPSALTLDENAIAIGSLSKVYGLSGLRVGWLAGPRDIIDECRRVRHYTTIAPPLIVQDLGAMALENSEDCLKRTRDIVTRNYSCATGWLEQHKEVFDRIEPQAGLVMLIKLRREVCTDEFVRELAKEKKVFLIPCSTTFNMAEGYLRLGLGTSSDVMVEGLNRVHEFVAAKGWI